MFPYSTEDFKVAYQRIGFIPIKNLTWFCNCSGGKIIGCCPIAAIRADKYGIKTTADLKLENNSIGLSGKQEEGFMMGFDQNQEFQNNEHYRTDPLVEEAYKAGCRVYRNFKNEGLI